MAIEGFRLAARNHLVLICDLRCCNTVLWLQRRPRDILQRQVDGGERVVIVDNRKLHLTSRTKQVSLRHSDVTERRGHSRVMVSFVDWRSRSGKFSCHCVTRELQMIWQMHHCNLWAECGCWRNLKAVTFAGNFVDRTIDCDIMKCELNTARLVTQACDVELALLEISRSIPAKFSTDLSYSLLNWFCCFSSWFWRKSSVMHSHKSIHQLSSLHLSSVRMQSAYTICQNSPSSISFKSARFCQCRHHWLQSADCAI